MNIIKTQNDLKNLSDEAVTHYYHNPTKDVPMFLSLSELMRRKEMRDDYQAQKPEQKTVAEDLIQEFEPGVMGLPQGKAMQLAMQPPPEMPTEQMAQGGLADLDTGDMYDESNYASGGIVAFEEGGSTWDKVRNYLLPPSPSKVRDLQSKTRLSPFMGGMGDIDAYKYADPNYLLKKREMLYKQLDVPGADKNAIYDQINALDQQIKTPAGGYVPTQKPALTDAEVAAKNLLTQTDPNKQSMPKGGGVDSYMPKPLSVQEAMDREKEAMRLAGVDTDFFSKQAKDLAQQREELAKDRTQAGWLAFARAGFDAASAKPEYGKGQSAVSDFARGAASGLEQYGKDSKEFRAENRLLKAADMKLAEAQNAQQRGDAQSALKAIQEREKLIAEYNHYRMTTGATLEAAKIAAGSRTGLTQLPALYNALNRAQQAGNMELVAQIQERIDAIESGDMGGASSSTAGWGNFKAVKPAK